MTTQSAAVLEAPPIGTTMLALVKETAGPGAALREIPVPVPGPTEVLVRVHDGICASE